MPCDSGRPVAGLDTGGLLSKLQHTCCCSASVSSLAGVTSSSKPPVAIEATTARCVAGNLAMAVTCTGQGAAAALWWCTHSGSRAAPSHRNKRSLIRQLACTEMMIHLGCAATKHILCHLAT